MSTGTIPPSQGPARSTRRAFIIMGMALIVFGAIAVDTKVVRIGSDEDAQGDVFSPDAFGAATFPEIQASVERRAVDAVALAAEIAADKAAATAKHGVPAGIGAVFPVSFTGVLGEGKSGVYEVAIDGLPDDLMVRVQTGPAINGTELRDATGEIAFGDFTNQIEYQNAGAAVNTVMKTAVLADLDIAALAGGALSVTGVFTLINPKSWLVTPVRIETQ